LTSTDYAWLLYQQYKNPDWDCVDAISALSEEQLRLDTVWGVSLLSESPEVIRKLFIKPDDYEFNGRASGLQMSAFLGRKVNKICNTRFLTIINTFTGRAPVTDSHKLEAELTKIREVQEQLIHQGEEPSEVQLYSVLYNAITVILLQPELNMVLGAPVMDCIKENGKGGTKLLEVLTVAAWEINNNPLYAQKATVGAAYCAEITGPEFETLIYNSDAIRSSPQR